MIIIFPTIDSYNQFISINPMLPEVIDGSGPVTLGTPAQELTPGTRCAISYSFTETDVAWFTIEAAALNIDIEASESLPVDWGHSYNEIITT